MRILASTVIVMVALSGCMLTDRQRAVFDTTCAALTTAYQVYTDKHKGVPNKNVEAAWDIGSRACKNPPLDIATATTQIALAVYTISQRND